jgi:hypothetical protein
MPEIDRLPLLVRERDHLKHPLGDLVGWPPATVHVGECSPDLAAVRDVLLKVGRGDTDRFADALSLATTCATARLRTSETDGPSATPATRPSGPKIAPSTTLAILPPVSATVEIISPVDGLRWGIALPLRLHRWLVAVTRDRAGLQEHAQHVKGLPKLLQCLVHVPPL